MSQNDSLRLAQEFLGRMGSGAEPAEIAKLFSESVEREIAGDTGVLPWIGRKSVSVTPRTLQQSIDSKEL